MADDKPKALRGGGSTRFGDSQLAFGMERFSSSSHGDGDVIWRFHVNKFCGGHKNALIAADATLPILREMRRFIDQAIDLIETDGGRKEKALP